MSKQMTTEDVLSMSEDLGIDITVEEASDIAENLGDHYCEACWGTAKADIEELGKRRNKLLNTIQTSRDLSLLRIISLLLDEIEDHTSNEELRYLYDLKIASVRKTIETATHSVSADFGAFIKQVERE